MAVKQGQYTIFVSIAFIFASVITYFIYGNSFLISHQGYHKSIFYVVLAASKKIVEG